MCPQQIDEARDLSAFHEQLNNLITAPMMQFEDKNGPSYRLDLHANIFVTSNSSHPVKIASDDRRWVAVRCSDMHMQDFEYHGKIRAFLGEIEIERTASQLSNQRGLYQELMSRTVKHNRAFSSDRPKTEFYKECTVIHAPVLTKYLSSLCSVPSGMCRFSAADMFERFKDWADRFSFRHGYNGTSFGAEMGRYARDDSSGVIKLQRASSGNSYEIDVVKHKAYLESRRVYDEHAPRLEFQGRSA